MLLVESCDEKAMWHPCFMIKKFPPMRAGICVDRQVWRLENAATVSSDSDPP